MKFLLAFCLLGVAAIMVHGRIDAAYQRGYADATRNALRTNPPSEELELVCVGLWIGEQNKKWHSKDDKL